MSKGVKSEKCIMTVTGLGFETEAIVYPDRRRNADDFINTREHFEAIKARLENEKNQYHIYKLIPVQEKTIHDGGAISNT